MLLLLLLFLHSLSNKHTVLALRLVNCCQRRVGLAVSVTSTYTELAAVFRRNSAAAASGIIH